MNEGIGLTFKRDAATIESMRRAYAEMERERRKDQQRQSLAKIRILADRLRPYLVEALK